MKLEEPGRVVVLLTLIIAIIVISCEAGPGGHLVEDVPLAPLEECPAPVCPDPICPSCPACPVASKAPVTPPASAGPVDLNSATLAELDTLPGVGLSTAQRILAYRSRRPFRRTRDLMRVSGIGPAKYRRIAPHVVVGPGHER